MNDFILPDDIYAMTQQSSQDIADAWATLNRLCIFRQYPLDIAKNKVDTYVNFAGLNQIEAIKKVYHEVAAL